MCDSKELLCRLWLAFAEGLTSKARQRILERFGSYERFFDSFPGGAEGLISQGGADELRKLKAFGLDRTLLRLQELGIAVSFLRDSADYPHLLSQIPDPPDLLFCQGSLTGEERPAIAVVGSRRETRYGRQQAFEIAKQLAMAGVTVVSGLARGIDTAAHKGALEGGGRTVAVLGSGLNRVYPEENKALAEQIVASGGAVISELPPNTPPLAYHFPIRNRIVSGLCHAVLLVEAREKSGTLITVTHALEQGREVFALPGEVDAPGSLIPNRLIREGARLCTCAEDILEDMGWARPAAEAARQTSMALTDLSPDQKRIADALQLESLGFDELALRTGLDGAALGAELTMLEMDGIIEALPGKQFRMKRGK